MSPTKELLKKKPVVINLGLKSFHESLEAQKSPSIHVNWKPPAGGKKHLLEILKRIK